MKQFTEWNNVLQTFERMDGVVFVQKPSFARDGKFDARSEPDVVVGCARMMR